ncbi:MAG: hypothetical protein U5L11_14100 [Arhodomonas sp.]|nr:hypothetical protein [Arhodomonas sp.]
MLYTLAAVHRLLRARLPDYDYDRHFGSIAAVPPRHEPGQRPATGIHRVRPERAVVEALDALFGSGDGMRNAREAATAGLLRALDARSRSSCSPSTRARHRRCAWRRPWPASSSARATSVWTSPPSPDAGSSPTRARM